MKNKKADLTTNQIITIIILIISFSIIIAFFFLLNPRSTIDRDACRNSVVLRSTLPAGSNVVKLQCQTEEVCFTKRDICREVSKDATIIKVQDKDELLDKLTDLMYECHWQMGGGKLDYLPENWGADKNYCGICDVMYFDDSIKEDKTMSLVPVRDVYNALKNKPVPEGDTSMLYDMYGINSINSLEKNPEVTKQFNNNFDFSFEKGHLIITYLRKPGRGVQLAIAGAGLVVGLLIPPLGASLLVGGGIAGIGVLATAPGDNEYLPPSIYQNTVENIKDLNCKDFTSLA